MTSAPRRPAKKTTATRKPVRPAAARNKPARKPVKAKAKVSAATLKGVIVAALEDMKAQDIKVLDVRGLTDVADFMLVASGTSDRHVRSIAESVMEKSKAAGYRTHGVEGRKDSEWVLIDLSDIIVHVMLPRTREFYGLEKLWDQTLAKRAVRA
jgi:ribosome-associated protein